MKLSKKFNHAALATLLATTAAAGILTGCGEEPSFFIEDKEVRPYMKLSGTTLQPGKHYEYEYGVEGMDLTIVGDVPAGTSITNNGGQILVTGNVGKGAKLKVKVPMFTHTEDAMCSTKRRIEHCLKVVEDAPLPPFDQDPVIVVQGTTAYNAKLSSGKGAKIKANFSPPPKVK